VHVTEHIEGAHWRGHPINAARVDLNGHPALVYQLPEDADTMGELDEISKEAMRQNPGQRVFACIDAEAYARALTAETERELQLSNVLEYLPGRPQG
jgi:hypothetical protein